ncbi:murein biosynthesis integral membrane protein MurJ [Geoalkalibacter halelectricus]|uniref:Probable lipid II flippase MurJ n=1 Tax=Geoalkalibacter halelectricus TaxID=2847045 RepID=A0ABY5ZP71_9BACT|nr:murein biosynthesis integral membrane protein MurJ [Geoalkalibacter halelectricus]MDO3380038.1 murein biosynthesis integral membrane protein MurJ [Geoalkalibacter halelectricus]UWZ80438.1 murein biosynthesis integral membrane protein MurJ [Geoalkalibacter halelectricus]
MSEKSNITRATGVLGVATLLSRITGLVRDVVIGRMFGAGFATDAFFMAFTLPNLLRRFFAEGSLTAAFVPTYSDVYHQQGREEAVRVGNICFTLLLVIMAVVTLVGIFASPWLVKAIGFGFGEVEGKLQLTDLLNRIMFPYIFFVSLLALLTGKLNVHGHYFVPALSPALLNLAMVAAAALLSPLFDPPIKALAFGVLLGGVLQLLMQGPILRRYGILPRLNFHWRHPAVRRIGLLMLPGVLGVAIYQINVVVTRLLASFLPEGSVSYLYYGQRLFEFPQGIFIVSLAQAVLPSMSRQAAAGDEDGLKESLDFALRMIAVVTLPAALGLMLCAVPIYSLLFLSATFDFTAVRHTAAALIAYAPGLFFLGIARVIVPTFYALKDTRTPVLISFWTLLINATLGLVLMQFWGHVGLALALTLATLANCLLLAGALRNKLGRLGLGRLLGCCARMLVPLLAMTAVVLPVLQLADWQGMGAAVFWTKALVLLLAIGLGMLVYALTCLAVGVQEVREAWAAVRRRFTRRSRNGV